MSIDKFMHIFEECELTEHKICIKDKMYEAIALLKNDYHFKMLKSITAVDLNDEIELIYNLYSPDNDEDVELSIKIRDEAVSISDLFESAKADENEIYDMFGVRFIGNDDLKRLYMPENWKGYPLRKDYVQDDTRLAWNDNDSNNA